MKRAIARQAEAERERRAKIIAADGELQASEKLGPGSKSFSGRTCFNSTALSTNLGRNSS